MDQYKHLRRMVTMFATASRRFAATLEPEEAAPILEQLQLLEVTFHRAYLGGDYAQARAVVEAIRLLGHGLAERLHGTNGDT